MSSYPSLAPVFRESDLENGLWQFARELKFFGVNLEQVWVLCVMMSHRSLAFSAFSCIGNWWQDGGRQW